MLLWFPEHVPRETVLEYVQGFPRDSFQQIVQDRVYSRYPTFNHVKVYIDSNFEEIDTTCAICYEPGEYQLDCGHIFHNVFLLFLILPFTCACMTMWTCTPPPLLVLRLRSTR